MAKRNVEAFQKAHKQFNKRDFDGLITAMADNFTYVDRARGLTFKGRVAFKDFMQGWVTAFPDAKVAQPKYTDAGDRVIAEFTGKGTNNGPLGPMPATGKVMNLPFCEVMTFNKKGKIASGVVYYDQMTLLGQLGHVPAPTA